MQRRTLLLGVAAAAVAPAAHAAPPPVVLELFTSQGCSSCPPADALLGELARQPGVIALAWHIDYWNGLGWRDPYATASATERQRAYATRLGEEVYTPALVVDGASMVVGSDGHAVAAAIAHAPAASVPVTLRREAGSAVAEIGPAPFAVSALLVAFDPMRVTAVGAGENSGRHLTEYRIVREAASLGTWQGAARNLALPAVEPGRGAALLLQAADLRVIGAAQLAASNDAGGVQRA